RPEPPEPRHAAVRAVPPVICRRLSRIAGLLLERGQDLCASRVEVAKRSLGGVAALVAAARKQKTRACERENQEKKPKNSAEEIGGGITRLAAGGSRLAGGPPPGLPRLPAERADGQLRGGGLARPREPAHHRPPRD